MMGSWGRGSGTHASEGECGRGWMPDMWRLREQVPGKSHPVPSHEAPLFQGPLLRCS